MNNENLKKAKLDRNDISLKGMSSVDDVGQVFLWDKRIFRGIYPSAVPAVRKMFSCGLIDELVEQELIPETRCTDYVSDEYPLILESRRIFPVTYPYEWTFDMLMNAGELVCRISKVLDEYGYVLKDCHPYNILFDKTRPLFVDIGSIVLKDRGISCNKEFIKWYVLLLRILAISGTAGRTILRGANDIEMGALLDLRHWSRLKRLFIAINDRAIFYSKKYECIFWEMAKYFIPKKQKNKGRWADYQTFNFKELLDKNYLPKDFSRFPHVLRILQPLQIESIFEVAGNQGAMACYLTKHLLVKRYFCSDYDEWAVNALYRFIVQYGSTYSSLKKIYPMIIDFTEVHHFYQLPSFEERIKSDLIIAMAVTHHLILTQGMEIDAIFERFFACTKRYILVEFMPLGLWDGKSAPALPQWYSLGWFIEHMKRWFSVLHVEQIEENRIMILGEIVASNRSLKHI